MSKSLIIFVHVVLWGLQLVINLVLWSLPFYTEGEGHLQAFIIHVIFNELSFITFFYVNYLFIVPYFLIRKRFAYYFLLVSAAFIFQILCSAYLWNGYTFIPGLFLPNQVDGAIFTAVYFLCISTGVSMFDYWIASEKNKQDLEKEVIESELLFLKSQMSPHFLFNTFNNIYGLSLKGMPQTADAILQLKDMLVYFEYFEKGEKITLEKELLYLQSFIDLNKLRFSVPVVFEKQVNDTRLQRKIEPMLFLPFIENAFKHGNTGKNSPIQVLLSVNDDKMVFSVANELQANKRKDRVGGIGIANVKRRLELLYPSQYQFDTFQDETVFKITLAIRYSM